MTRRAKVVCTLGPASSDEQTIRELATAGMSVARFNASHGTTDQRERLIDRVRAVNEAVTRPIATLLDLAGPEIRTASIDESVQLATGKTVEFARGDHATNERVGLTVSLSGVEPGDSILIDDGRIEAVVTAVGEQTIESGQTATDRVETDSDHTGDNGVETDGESVVRARIESGGELASRSGVNVPGVDLGLPTVTEADRRELDLASEKSVDFVAASFVRSGADVYEVGAELEDCGADIPIIAKIERADAVENIDDLIEAADGIMVARGDLGVECPLEDVPIIQKQLIRRCQHAGVPVITATEMLDSMVHAHRPTRAEASDVANAVLDGTDALMLSAETAVGDHPVRVVETMCRIIHDVEESDEYAEILEGRVPPASGTRTGALARSARYLARDLDASAVVVASESGYTARKAAKYRPHMPIVAATPEDRVRRQLALVWGITPKPLSHAETADAVIQDAVQSAIDAGATASGDTVVVLSGMMTATDDLDTANMLKVHVASQRLVSGRSVVSGFATGTLYRVEGGDLSDAPDRAILAVPDTFDGEFVGDLSTVVGIVDAHEGMTGYAAIVARELDVPMVSHAVVPESVEDGREVTLDAERGVVYADPLDE